METSFLTQQFVPLLFGGLLVMLLTGFPVAFALAATGLGFGWLGMELGMFPAALFQALPLRIFGIMQNDTLLAIPFFTFMGLILERSGMAEDLLDTIGQLFGPVRGGLSGSHSQLRARGRLQSLVHRHCRDAGADGRHPGRGQALRRRG